MGAVISHCAISVWKSPSRSSRISGILWYLQHWWDKSSQFESYRPAQQVCRKRNPYDGETSMKPRKKPHSENLHNTIPW